MSRMGCGATMQCTPTTGAPLWPAWGVHQGRQGWCCPWFWLRAVRGLRLPAFVFCQGVGCCCCTSGLSPFESVHNC